MAEAIVSMVLEGFKSLLVNEAKSLRGVSDQFEHAQIELYLMRGYLKDADAKQGDDELVRIWVGIIRDAAYDLEDIIESFVLKVAARRKRSMKLVLKRYACILSEGINRHKIGSEIENIATKLSKLKSSLEGYSIARQIGGSLSATSFERQQDYRLTYSHVVEHHFVELKEEIDLLAENLVKKNYQIVSIWGMGGLGKTTLAKHLNNHKDVRAEFDCFAWVCVTQQFRKEDVWKKILVQLTSDADKDKIEKMETDEIAGELCVLQRKKKCLVVLDDMWTRDAWKSLRAGFPMNEGTGSRVLITTRNKEVVSEAHESVYLHQIRPLNDAESWELFKKIVTFGRDNTNSEDDRKKEKLGEEMLKHCAGSPLAIVVLAGLLARKETVEDWKTVQKNVGAYIGRGTDLESRYKGENSEGTSRVLALSYESLPYHLKPCFLYLGHFPEDREIPMKRLIQLWIAEGFIYSASGELLEDVAYNCLNELVIRCMVQVGHRGSTNKIKSCRLHDLMRDLCLLKAKHENFVHISDSFARATPVSPSGKVRRNVIYLDKIRDILTPPTDAQLRSLLYFTSEYRGVILQGKPIRPRFQDFKLLRVLSLEEFERKVELPSTIGNLVHLRFFSLNGCFVTRFPSSMSKLVCLQTLDLRCLGFGRKRRLRNLHNVIRHLGQLRHLYLPAIWFREAEKRVLPLATLGNLQTLVNVSNYDSGLSDLTGLASLRKMSIVIVKLKYGMKIIDSESIRSNHVQSLSLSLRSSTKVEVLVMILLSCRNIYKLKLQGRIAELPKDLLDYPNLTKIKLYRASCMDEHIKLLEQLPHLKFLTLQGVTLENPILVFSKQGFPCLEFLSISMISQLKEWRVEQGAMNCLRRLQVIWCPQLKEVPDGLRYIGKLEELSIRMPREFCSALRKGGKDFDKIKHVASVNLDSEE
ncbi:putative disease resistance protein At1g50180 [Pyrus communis]|uniref:putative disease resistance protein At1g50180 n=1 Tax=Pyrus communis TaxID=23211 RepID=UPI0035C06CC5